MLKWYGCEKVMVVDLSEFRLENARRLGFPDLQLRRRKDLQEKAFAEFGKVRGYPSEKCGARLYVDAVGVASVIESFAQLAPRNGSLSIVGVHKAPVPLNLTQVAFNNWHIHGCGDGVTEELWPEILEMMRSGQFDLPSLVTHEFSVERINDAITLAAQADEAQKVCISFGDDARAHG